ncbi:MAG: diguanylate cyclase (GGDEF)-like protein/PAS domain S-box-containing protein [Paraglaciecola sp.]|jgi:diguanylate cyclase (GGDEF)-like protein/PAS domain S-box-containing protein|uniref:sensor domain-containing protein n=1 Tax=uncultured Paraglaciecola sp. TaxID=1765024 RepID=UPI0025E4F059|nr:EAL domain-containing protein [uncultured Paraglaciecola sp.]
MTQYSNRVLNAMRAPLVTLDKNLRVVNGNHSFYKFFKVKPENTVGSLIYELNNKQWDIPALRELLENILPQKTSFNNYLIEYDFANIGRRIMLLNAREIENLEGKQHVILLSMEDVTDRADKLVIANEEKDKLADELVIANEEKDKLVDELVSFGIERERLLQKIKRAATIFTHSHESIMITDADATITEVNHSFNQMTGYCSKDVVGENSIMVQSGDETPEFFAEMWDSLLSKGHWHGEIWYRRKSGDVYPAKTTITAMENANGVIDHYVSLSTDISSMKALQGQLKRLIHFDALTNLPNRILLADRLSQSMEQCQPHNQSLAVAFMDLDGFKEVNDKHGHNVGDDLLISVSHRMKAALCEFDTLARIGGDEFIAIMVNLDNPEDSAPILERLLEATAEPFTLGGAVTEVTVSIGVTLYPQDGSGVDQLIRHADQAMHVAKQAGKNRYRLFDTAKNNEIKIQLASIENIVTGLSNREFVLYYQPKVNMSNGEVIGAEALIRWQHPVRGLVPPLDFLPMIEGQTVSIEIGEWVILSALTQISQWQSEGLNLPISVNISAYQLQEDNFTNRLTSLLSSHPEVNPYCLELEILETSALNDIDKVFATMSACNELGVRFALDDFGTGYSSLTYLRRLPANLIKIDQTFVRDMLEDTEDCAIVEGIIGLAKSFRRDVIAEGVETMDHGTVLLQMGCELAQGYGIARPMPAGEIHKWVSNWKADDYWQA